MELLKQLTSVPLFATAIWLTWVFGHLYDPDGVDRSVGLLLCFLLLAIAGWALGRWPARWGSAIAAILLIATAIALPLRPQQPDELAWQPFTEDSLAAARASGHPVFVDFTASWCLSCQVNERVVLRSAAVKKKFADTQTVLLKADWTKYDPVITRELSAIGRSGVPAYVIYPPGKNTNGDVLPEVLTQSLVLKQLEKDSKSN
jgi:thiol:disulfide interchange protein DsbD